jgi:hypothetical protein
MFSSCTVICSTRTAWLRKWHDIKVTPSAYDFKKHIFRIHSCLLTRMSFDFWHSHESVSCTWTYSSSVSWQKEDKNHWSIRLRHLISYGFWYFVYNAFWTLSSTLQTAYQNLQYIFSKTCNSFHTLYSQIEMMYQCKIKRNNSSLCYLYCEHDSFPRTEANTLYIDCSSHKQTIKYCWELARYVWSSTSHLHELKHPFLAFYKNNSHNTGTGCNIYFSINIPSTSISHSGIISSINRKLVMYCKTGKGR